MVVTGDVAGAFEDVAQGFRDTNTPSDDAIREAETETFTASNGDVLAKFSDGRPRVSVKVATRLGWP